MYGWTCPGCNRCYSPSMMMCSTCGVPTANSSATTFTVYCNHVYESVFYANTDACTKCGQLRIAQFSGSSDVSVKGLGE